MSQWDWNAFGEIFLGVALGIIVGTYIAIGFVRGFAYELLAHPTVRKFATAADKLGGKGGGLWETIIGRVFGGGDKK